MRRGLLISLSRWCQRFVPRTSRTVCIVSTRPIPTVIVLTVDRAPEAILDEATAALDRGETVVLIGPTRRGLRAWRNIATQLAELRPWSEVISPANSGGRYRVIAFPAAEAPAATWYYER